MGRTYRLCIEANGATTVEGYLRLDEAGWHLEVGDLQVQIEPEASDRRRPAALLAHLDEWLRANGYGAIRGCGNCRHFRRAPEDEAWHGFCNWQHPEDPAYIPERIAWLAPACHHFHARATGSLPPLLEIPPAEEALVTTAEDRIETEVTLALRPTPSPVRQLIDWLRRLLRRPRRLDLPMANGAVRSESLRCPCCQTPMRERASIVNSAADGTERLLSLWYCPTCYAHYLDDWFEAWVGSPDRDAERLYVIPPSLSQVALRMIRRCPHPTLKGCHCPANRWFERLGDELYEVGIRFRHHPQMHGMETIRREQARMRMDDT